MTRIVAVDYDSGHALFDADGQAVVIDINKVDAKDVCTMDEALTAAAWLRVSPDLQYPPVWRELADAAVAKVGVKESEAKPQTERKFRIPQAVQKEAQQGIDWVTGFERGNSVLGMNIAKLLANETYLSNTKLQRIARYFANRPKSITENAGWSPGEHGYPTDARIKYSLWGGEAAREWVTKIQKTHPIIADAAPVPTEEAKQEIEIEVEDAPDVPDGDADLDGNEPHEYAFDPETPAECLVCGREEGHEIHQQAAAVVAGAFMHEEDCDYFGKGISPDSTEVTELYVMRPDGTWGMYDGTGFVDIEEPAEDVILIMLDPESAEVLAEYIESRDPESQHVPFELATINPFEAAMFAAAEAEIDWELVDRVFDIYDSQERSINAQKQVRGPGGRFGDMPDDPDSQKEDQSRETKARLPRPLPLVPDLAARIDQYLADVAKKRGAVSAPEDVEGEDTAEDGPVMAAAGDPGTVTDVRPLYLAIVDSVDTEAVLDLVSLVPPAPGSQGDVTVWRRNDGTWVQDNDLLADLRGVTPPPVVELTDDSLLQNVIDQVDKATADDGEVNESEPGAPAQTPEDAAPKPDANPDQHPQTAAAGPEFGDKSADKRDKLAKKGYALPDGSFPIENVADLKNAIQAHGRAKNKSLAKRHITKRARALNRTDLLPDGWSKSSNSDDGYAMWGPCGEIFDLSTFAEGGADRNRGGAEHLRRYWTKGEGAAKIQWNTPGDWYRCVSQLSKYLGTRAKGYCTLRHKEATGSWPGEENNH